jgi:GntR family transcriptional regulator, rspAB operon transcriptional repressor
MNLDFALKTLDGDNAVRQATRGNRVFDAIRQAIVQLQLRPGNLLSEAEVARQLGVSRQPVREAFIKLGEVGLVEVRPQRGTFVVMISKREVQNARFIREAIEVAVARKAALEATPEQIAALRTIVDRQRETAALGNHAVFLELDEAFHEALAHSADCDHAWRVLEGLKAQMDRVRWLSMPDATPFETLIAQHTAIVDALEAKSPEAAEAAMHTHLGEILTSLPRLAAQYPELFVD